MNGQNMPAITT